MTERILTQAAAEVLSLGVPGQSVAEVRAEVLARVIPGAELATLVSEFVATVQPKAEVTQALVEFLATVQPKAEVAQALVEFLATVQPSAELSQVLAEVLRNNVAGGAGGQAQRDVFAFRHNWAEPLVERLEWQTRVARTASGLEAREANRSQPRRSLTYRVGTGRTCDALVADWLAEHLGKPAWWPLPQHAARLTLAAEAGATTLQTAGIEARHFGPPSAQWLLGADGVQGWQGSERHALLIGPNGWRAVRIQAIAGDAVQLADPLPGAAPAGSSLMPLLWGRANEPVNLTQLLPGVATGSVSAQFDPAPEPDQAALDDPLLDGIPVWPDGDWSSDPGATVAASVTQHDFSPAQPWLRRDDPWTLSTLSRRYVAASSAAIDAWRARLWRAHGRLHAFWLPDGLAPVLRLTQSYQPEDGWLSVDAGQATSFWHRPAACLILLPDGQRLHALTGALEPEAGGVLLMLRSTLDVGIPAGSRVIRLMRCRLDHDAVDLHWHAPELVELALTARQLPEAQSLAPIDWPKVIAPPPMAWPMTLSAPPRPPQFQCPPPPRPMLRLVLRPRFVNFRLTANNWTVPDGVHEIFVTGCGAGGPARGPGTAVFHSINEGSWNNPVFIYTGAGGGGAGGGGGASAVIRQRFTVKPGDAISVLVPMSVSPGAEGSDGNSPDLRIWNSGDPHTEWMNPPVWSFEVGGGLPGEYGSSAALGNGGPDGALAAGGAGGAGGTIPGQPGQPGLPRRGLDGGRGGDGGRSPLWGTEFSRDIAPFGGEGAPAGGILSLMGWDGFTMSLPGDGALELDPGAGRSGDGGTGVRQGGHDGSLNVRVAPAGSLFQSNEVAGAPFGFNERAGGPGIAIVEWEDPTPPEGQPL